ncbi:FHA domain-containing protein [Agromyces larvae]|uniref:FHA domain-containing protein n=1 Tax=Agromyces larvae TaxID=2929802 RepID=A0ABY4BTW3_9MICO|nr:FHA domain-containing protein [Agromyces larvae]UOE42651.1 FHA domain-containing protein [Agromyces larvae]
MASAHCVYCDATLQPNSMYCVQCGQLIPQANEPQRPPAPPQFGQPPAAVPPAGQPQQPAAAAAAAAASPARPSIEPIPLPRSLPWQQAGADHAVAQPAPAPAQPAPVERVELAFSTGQRVVVTGSAVIGRKPTDTALAMGARAVEVQDDTRSVSRVHLFLEVADGVVLVGDAGSANGSRLERAGLMTPLEAAGTRVRALVGDRIWLGDLSFELRAA